MLKPLSQLVCALPLMMAASCYADDATALKDALAQLDNLKANFSQQVTDVNNKVIQQGSGTFALAVPNQFYWHLTQPDESLIVADGRDVWIYNPFAEEVSVLDFNQAIDASPIALLVHRDEVTWQDYRVERQDDCYQIAPKAVDASVTGVEVCFKEKQLEVMKLTDQQGNLSVFNLSAQAPLAEDDAKLFQFTVPEGVDIDDQRLKSLD
ncbi:outer membrane lipoprotein chaperone LolA [Shewanella sp. Isolate7]|uniref:outer membrane lipoprotein chaperone LolA n=1 Tax=Shewanella sp. Isolate7 TaxID=2908528 RepID=UPI001EFD9475|nr:outer membrane lipoprotein chaperone LolA [Shewanella sp. Isolate7]MCG9722063.1 outer membrane lipoprotein chaperone LolA [Shewanella sp. Isolate7]